MEEKISQEEREKIPRKLGQNVMNLGYYFKSHDYSLEEMEATTCFFLAIIQNALDRDEEDLRNVFRLISIMKERVIFQ